jgi:hypothetical protein
MFSAEEYAKQRTRIYQGRLHDVTAQQVALSIVAALGTSNPTDFTPLRITGFWYSRK